MVVARSHVVLSVGQIPFFPIFLKVTSGFALMFRWGRDRCFEFRWFRDLRFVARGDFIVCGECLSVWHFFGEQGDDFPCFGVAARCSCGGKTDVHVHQGLYGLVPRALGVTALVARLPLVDVVPKVTWLRLF